MLQFELLGISLKTNTCNSPDEDIWQYLNASGKFIPNKTNANVHHQCSQPTPISQASLTPHSAQQPSIIMKVFTRFFLRFLPALVFLILRLGAFSSFSESPVASVPDPRETSDSMSSATFI